MDINPDSALKNIIFEDSLYLAELEQTHLSWAGHIQAPLITVENLMTIPPPMQSTGLINVMLNRDQTFFHITGQAKSIQQFNRFLTTNSMSI